MRLPPATNQRFLTYFTVSNIILTLLFWRTSWSVTLLVCIRDINPRNVNHSIHNIRNTQRNSDTVISNKYTCKFCEIILPTSYSNISFRGTCKLLDSHKTKFRVHGKGCIVPRKGSVVIGTCNLGHRLTVKRFRLVIRSYLLPGWLWIGRDATENASMVEITRNFGNAVSDKESNPTVYIGNVRLWS